VENQSRFFSKLIFHVSIDYSLGSFGISSKIHKSLVAEGRDLEIPKLSPPVVH
jgi:hypothetical protein